MPANVFEELEEIYPKIVNLMPDKFDSHDFILKLAQEYQKLYVQALVEHVKDDRPFQIVHGQIAKRLHNFPHLVIKIDEGVSKDIFLQENSAAIWKKV